ncbi:MAG: amino acid adenylation domain-containing protein [Gammaproteobacteria bacterium]|nr:amino acid adenylation domain-containing protein [Gammaproteobacteria bacterium]
MTVLTTFRTVCKNVPEKTAIVDDAELCTYQELDRKSDAVAQIILNKIGPQQPILLLLEPSIEQIIAILAIMKARCYYIPCDVRLPEERLSFILEDSATTLVISSKQHVTSKNLGPEIDNLYIEDVIGHNSPNNDQLESPHHTDLAYVIYTSGTTGNPKGVKISHGNLSALFSATEDVFSFSDNDVWAYLHSYAFDFAVWEMWGALSSGATLSLFSYDTIASPEILTDELLSKNISVLNQTPSAFYRIKDQLLSKIKDQDQTSLRYIIFGGEKLEAVNIKSWIDFYDHTAHPLLVNMYGITEGTVHCTFSLVHEVYPIFGAKNIIGNPLKGFAFHLLPINEAENELLISGPSVCQGYLNRPKLEKEKFITIDNVSYFRTGDLVRQLDDNLEYVGRADDQVKIRGYRINLGEINYHLGTYPNIQSAITLSASNTTETELVSFVTTSEQEQGEIKKHGQEQIEHWKKIYDDLYSHDFKTQDHTFNIKGWNNSYSDQPFSKAVMQEWLQDTIDKINTLTPKSVLEIGCGSGLILFGLLDKIDSYTGIDISNQTISQLRLLTPEQKVSLFVSDASNFDAIAALKGKKFDCIIINSVVQYFPSIQYLHAFIRKLKRFLTQDASIFFGDIRNYDLLHEYHYFITECRTKQKDISLEQLKDQTYTSVLQEQELLISPDFFTHQAPQLLGVDNMTVSLLRKPGAYENELNLFRYDAILKFTHDEAVKKIVHYSGESQQQITEFIKNICFEKEALLISCLDKTLRGLTQNLAEDPSTGKKITSSVATTIPNLTQLLRQLNVEYKYVLNATEPYHFDAILYRGLLPIVAHETNRHSRLQYANHPVEIEQDIFAYLRKKVPFYTVPSYLHVIDCFPITNNGKIDKDRLLAFHAQKSYEQSFIDKTYSPVVEENIDAKEILINIWQKVLKLKTVRLDDDFFEMGGDSISSLQIIQHCKQAGFQLSVRDLFTHRTINNLALMIEKISAAPVLKKLPTSHFDLSPIQDWFFQCHQGVIHEYCQSFVLELQPNIDQKIWVDVLKEIFESRSSFKLRFQKTTNQWVQSFQNNSHVTIHPQNIVISDKHDIIEHIRAEKYLINIEQGYSACVHFFIKEAQHFCVISIHHLIIDAISWKNLLDDICTLYVNTKLYQKSLPSRECTHYEEYVNAIKNIPLSLVLDDLKFWLSQLGPNFFEKRPINYQDTRQIKRSLPLGHIPINTSDMVSIQLVALYLSLRALKKQEIVLTLEKHGREECISSDIESSLGWHTSLFPVKLDFGDLLDTQQLLQKIKTLLAEIPHGGVTFFSAKQHGLLPIPQETYTSDISFNFLGNLDQTFQNNCVLKNISPIVESFNQINLSCPFALQVNTFIQNKHLVVHFIYDKELREQTTEIAEKFHNFLEEMLFLYQKSYTYPLTNMQNYLQLFSDFPCQFHQVALKINSSIQRAPLEKSLTMILNHFDIFKMNFKNDAQYLSLDVKNLLVKEHFVNSENKTIINNVLLDDLKQPFNADTEYLVRLNIIHTKQNTQIIILTYHQYVLDGWALQQFLSLWSSLVIDLENNIKSHNLTMPTNDLYLDYLQQLAVDRKNRAKAPNLTHCPKQCVSAVSIVKQRYGTHQNTMHAYGKIIHVLNTEEFADLQSICGMKKITMSAFLMTAFGYFLAQEQKIKVQFKMIEAGRLNSQFDYTIGALTTTRSIVINCSDDFMNTVSDVSHQLINIQESPEIIDPSQEENLDELVVSFQNFKKIDDISTQFANRKLLNIFSLEKSNSPLTIRFLPSDHLEIWVGYQEQYFNKINLEKMCADFVQSLVFLKNLSVDKTEFTKEKHQKEPVL